MNSLSYTTLSELERCGYRYYLERVLEFPEAQMAWAAAGAVEGGSGLADRDGSAAQGRGGLGGRTRGVIVHRLLESLDYVSPNPPGPDEVGAVAGELGVLVGPAEREELAALVAMASASELAQRLAAAPRIRRELPFGFGLGPSEPLVTGVFDATVHDLAGDLLIVDYKTDRVADDEDLGALVEQSYGAQRLLYALAGLREGAQEVEVVHWFLERPSEWVAARFGQADRAPLEAQLQSRIETVRKRGFAVSSTPRRSLCLTCPGRAGMCSWGDSHTLR